MSIQKMTLVNIKGSLPQLDDTIVACSDLRCFHPKDITPTGNISTSFQELEYRNPYQKLLQKIVSIAGDAGVRLKFSDIPQVVADKAEIKLFINTFYEQFCALKDEIEELTAEMDQHANALIHIRHVDKLDISFDSIFSSVYLKLRFGRLPRDSSEKLAYYANKMFLFFPFDEDENYIWGIYFTTNEYLSEIDDIFSSLFFERVRIPDYVHGTPQRAIDMLQKQYNEEKEQLASAKKRLEAVVQENKAQLILYYCQVKFLCSTFELRRFVGVSGDNFHMAGFIPKSDEQVFKARLDRVPGLALDLLPEDTDKRFQPPTLLRNNFLFRPFEMFVKMYGMPSHSDIDPTPYVAIVYSLLFGIMFGDVGQGLLLSAVGFLVYKYKGVELGAVMTRIGFSSAFFGLMYGSVFGFEHLLDGLWRALGLEGKPIEVMAPETINLLLVGAVVFGSFIIVTSITINIVMGLKTRDWDRAVFSQNGIAGLVFYLTILLGVLCTMLGLEFFSPVSIGLGIVLPVLVMFFREPLSALTKGARGFHLEGGIGAFIAESFFEMFEVVLSFLTNTVSFLRVGGFILSHAGMMAVVFTLSEMVSAGASPVVIVLGNLFVMCLEGLIVGIQVLRLQFFEMFSRFFGGEGEPFEPISVDLASDD